MANSTGLYEEIEVMKRVEREKHVNEVVKKVGFNFSLEDAIAELMFHYGPDGHCDGSDIIAFFIKQLIETKPLGDVLKVCKETVLQ